MAVVYLDIETGRRTSFLVQATYREGQALKQFGARWVPSLMMWRLPTSVDLIELTNKLPALILSDEVAAWLADELARQTHLRALYQADDAVIANPDGLDPYQRVGVRFLADAGRAILADDVGLGKTVQAIRAAMEVGSQRVLIITKKTLIHNWVRAVQRWSGRDAFTLTTQNTLPCPPPHFVATNYETVVRRLEELKACFFDTLIVDEAAAIKNRKAQRSKAIYSLAKTTDFVWLLTASPMPNSPDEIWSLLHCIRPDRYPSYWQFVSRHLEYERNYFGGVKILGVKNEKSLAAELAPLMLRRDKSILNLPPITHEVIWLQMDGEQYRIYSELRKKFITVLDEERVVTAPTVLAQLTRLRQVTCTPALIGGPDYSAKTEALIELLEELTPRHKVLVFTTFAEYVDLLLPKLQPFNPVCITGKVSQPERAEAERRLNTDDTCRVFLGTIQAAGEGLNLQAADVVIFLNKSWVPDDNDVQTVGRAHRRGQTRPVHVINLVASCTVDEYLEEVLREKKTSTEVIKYVAAKVRRVI